MWSHLVHSPLPTDPTEEEQEVRRRLVRYYERHNPQQLNHIDAILFAYKDHWSELFDALAAKYETPEVETPTRVMTSHSKPLERWSAPQAGNHFPTPIASHTRSLSHATNRSLSSLSSPPLALRDPMEVLRERCAKRNGRAFHSIDYGAVSRRLRLQQQFLRHTPNDVLRMEEVMAEFRRAYKDAAGHAVTEAEWQEAMTRAFVCAFDAPKPPEPSPPHTWRGGPMRQNSPLSPADPLERPESAMARWVYPPPQSLLPNAHVDSPSTHWSSTPTHSVQWNDDGTQQRSCAWGPMTDSTRSKPHRIHARTAELEQTPKLVYPKQNFVSLLACSVKSTPNSLQPLPDLLSPMPHSLSPTPPSLRPQSHPTCEFSKPQTTRSLSPTMAAAIPKASSSLSWFPSVEPFEGGGELSLLWPSDALSAFCRTPSEQQAEALLDATTRACPILHARLFLLVCAPMECAPPNAGVRLPFWEPSLQSCVLWPLPSSSASSSSSSSSSRGTVAFFAQCASPAARESLHAAWILCRVAGLASLWRDEVTFADVLALRMRFFNRRYASIRRVVLRPFLRIQRGASGVAWESRWFADAVAEMRVAFDSVRSAAEWERRLDAWRSAERLREAVAALETGNEGQRWEEPNAAVWERRPQPRRPPSPAITSASPAEGAEGAEVMALSLESLLLCAALLCVHVDGPFRGLTVADVAATCYCLAAAALGEAEETARQTVTSAWRMGLDTQREAFAWRLKGTQLQETERRRREALAVMELSDWMHMLRCALRESVCNAQTPNHRAAQKGTCSGRRNEVRRRLVAFFESEAERQRDEDHRRRVEQIAELLRVGRINI